LGGGALTATSSDLYNTGGDLQFNIDSGDTFQWNYGTYNQNVIQFRGLKKKPKDRYIVPSVAFGLGVGRDLTLEAQKERNKFRPIIYITGRQSGKSSYTRTITGTRRFQASVLPQRATIRITRTPKDHMDDIIKEYNRRPRINIRLKKKLGVITMVNGSKIYAVTDSSEYKHVTGKSTKLLHYSPWTSDHVWSNDINGNDLTDVGRINFANNGNTIQSRRGSDGKNYYNVNSVNFDDIEEAPMDIIAGANRAYALESLEDESRKILGIEEASDKLLEIENDGYDVCDLYNHAKGRNLAGSIPTSNLMIDTDGINTWLSKPLLVESKRPTITIKLKERNVLTYEGLVKAKQTLHDEGYL
jgi:hypothetical protein